MKGFEETKRYAKEWQDYYLHEAEYYQNQHAKFLKAGMDDEAAKSENWSLEYQVKASHYEIMYLALEAYENNFKTA